MSEFTRNEIALDRQRRHADFVIRRRERSVIQAPDPDERMRLKLRLAAFVREASIEEANLVAKVEAHHEAQRDRQRQKERNDRRMARRYDNVERRRSWR